MNEDVFNMSVRKFLKKVGVTAQREIEQAVREAEAGGKLKGGALPAKATFIIVDETAKESQVVVPVYYHGASP